MHVLGRWPFTEPFCLLRATPAVSKGYDACHRMLRLRVPCCVFHLTAAWEAKSMTSSDPDYHMQAQGSAHPRPLQCWTCLRPSQLSHGEGAPGQVRASCGSISCLFVCLCMVARTLLISHTAVGVASDQPECSWSLQAVDRQGWMAAAAGLCLRSAQVGHVSYHRRIVVS